MPVLEVSVDRAARGGKTEKQARSLIAYVIAKRREERRKTCLVCALPDDVRAEIASARTRKIERRVIREWLKVEHGVEIPDEAFTSHAGGRHEEAP